MFGMKRKKQFKEDDQILKKRQRIDDDNYDYEIEHQERMAIVED